MKEGDHSLAYVGGPRFVNPIYSIMEREAVASVSFQKNGPHTLHFFLHQYCGRTRIGLIHFHLLVMRSLKNLHVVKRQHGEEFTR